MDPWGAEITADEMILIGYIVIDDIWQRARSAGVTISYREIVLKLACLLELRNVPVDQLPRRIGPALVARVGRTRLARRNADALAGYRLHSICPPHAN